jgi:ABC-type transporter Mla maintaining outer membrane lipid asymmetry ATPase subunit MlaF
MRRAAMADQQPLIIVSSVEKDYCTLRPLRVQHLELRPAETVAVLGLDQAGAEVLINLIAGATVPDSGDVTIFGRSTRSIADGDEWMKALDDFGIISERAVLLEQMTTEQNLAVPLSLELHDIPADVQSKVAALAAEVSLSPEGLRQFPSVLAPIDRMRVRLARALAVAPRVLLAEHPNATLDPKALAVFAELLKRVSAARELATLVVTADRTFATAVADRVLAVNPATGELTPIKAGWWSRFR